MGRRTRCLGITSDIPSSRRKACRVEQGVRLMLIRVLTMHVVPERLNDWLRFTKEVGFPGMRRQPGCRGIWRLHKQGGGHDYQVVTLWDSVTDLERFRASP